MDVLASEIVGDWTVEVQLVPDYAAEADWYVITAHNELRAVTLATVPNVSYATDMAMEEFYHSTIEAIKKFGTLPAFAPHTHYAPRLITKAM